MTLTYEMILKAQRLMMDDHPFQELIDKIERPKVQPIFNRHQRRAMKAAERKSKQ